MCFNQRGDINTRLAKAWTTIDRLLVIRKSPDKIKRSSFQAAVVLVLLYGCTTWTLTKHWEKKLGKNTRMLRDVLNKFWKQHLTKQPLSGFLAPITKTIQIKRNRNCWSSKDELKRDILQWTLVHRRRKDGRPIRTYIQQLCADTGCCLEDLPGAMDVKTGSERGAKEIHKSSSTSWWWWHKKKTFKYCNLTLRSQLNIIHLHTVKSLQVLLCNTNNSIKHPSFVCTWFISFNYSK